jgi:TM2 domain-containing membrane protein YozV
MKGDALMAGQGSTGNVIAAVCSFFIPGLGQLVQGRMIAALLHFLIGVAVWVVTFGMFGWVVNLFSTVEAALWKPKTA